MDTNEPETSGGPAGTSGAGLRLLSKFGITILMGGMMLQTIVNSLSGIADRRSLGQTDAGWVVWTWETTSLVAWFLLFPIIGRAVTRLQMLRWPMLVMLHLGMRILVSLAHIIAMVTLRKAIYWLAGSLYHFATDTPSSLFYEYRKDFVTYFIIVAVFALVSWISFRTGLDQPALAHEPDSLIVQDGTRHHRILVDEIESLQAAGNYVEIAVRGQIILHRTTLAALELRLSASGLVRIHRSRLVCVAMIRIITSTESGDFDVVLTSGAILRGSRRYRSNLKQFV